MRLEKSAYVEDLAAGTTLPPIVRTADPDACKRRDRFRAPIAATGETRHFGDAELGKWTQQYLVRRCAEAEVISISEMGKPRQ